jgi:hypothetical protein
MRQPVKRQTPQGSTLEGPLAQDYSRSAWISFWFLGHYSGIGGWAGLRLWPGTAGRRCIVGPSRRPGDLPLRLSGAERSGRGCVLHTRAPHHEEFFELTLSSMWAPNSISLADSQHRA